MVGALILYALTVAAGMAVVYFEIRGHARLLQGVDGRPGGKSGGVWAAGL